MLNPFTYFRTRKANKKRLAERKERYVSPVRQSVRCDINNAIHRKLKQELAEVVGR